MPIYKKNSQTTYEYLIEEDLLDGSPQAFLGFEIKTGRRHCPHYLYVVESVGKNNRLVRYPLQKISEKLIPRKEYYSYDRHNGCFSTISETQNSASPVMPEAYLFADEEINYLVYSFNEKRLVDSCVMSESYYANITGDSDKTENEPIQQRQQMPVNKNTVRQATGDDVLDEQLYLCLASIMLPQGQFQSIDSVLSRPEYSEMNFRIVVLGFVHELIESEHERRDFNTSSNRYRKVYNRFYPELIENPGLNYIDILKSLKSYLIKILPISWMKDPFSNGIYTFLSSFPDTLILNDEILEAIKNHPAPWILLEALKNLRTSNILTKRNILMMCKHTNSLQFATELTNLGARKILTIETFCAVFGSEEPEIIAQMLLAHPTPVRLAKALLILKKFDLLDSENSSKLLQEQNPDLEAINIVRLAQLGTPPLEGVITLDQSKKSSSCVEIKSALDKLLQSTNTWPAKDRALVKDFVNEVDLNLKNYNPDLKRDPCLAKQELAQSVIIKAKKCFGIDHEVVRILADLLMVGSCFVGVGFVAIGVKKAYTGHCFFYFGKGAERAIIEKFEADLTTPCTI